jgi:hypothetical protein
MQTATTTTTIRIDPRFRGPDQSGNGGYVCGLVAEPIAGPAEVTLRQPPPLDTPLLLDRRDGPRVELRNGDGIVAEARPAPSQPEPPPPIELEAAARAALDPSTLAAHPFPGCFVCGPTRADGLRIFPGEVGDGLWSAVWTPQADVADDSGLVATPFVWAVLDCPSGWALSRIIDPGGVAVLGRLTVAIHQRPAVNAPCIVVADATGRDGRKLTGRSALYTSTGRLIALAAATWIALR